MTQTAITPSAPPQIPTAVRLPILGALPHVLHKQFDYLHQAHRQLGDIFRIDLGLTDVVALKPSAPRPVCLARQCAKLPQGRQYVDLGAEYVWQRSGCQRR